MYLLSIIIPTSGRHQTLLMVLDDINTKIGKRKDVEVIVEDSNLTQKQKCMYECWNAYAINLEMGDWATCTKGEIDNYKYVQAEKLFEHLNGRTDLTAKNYWRISTEIKQQSTLLKPYLTSIT